MDKKVKQVQVATDWHARLRVEAARQGLTMQAVLEQMMKDYFEGSDSGRSEDVGGDDDSGDRKRRR